MQINNKQYKQNEFNFLLSFPIEDSVFRYIYWEYKHIVNCQNIYEDSVLDIQSVSQTVCIINHHFDYFLVSIDIRPCLV